MIGNARVKRHLLALAVLGLVPQPAWAEPEASPEGEANQAERHRLFVLTDIEADPDDTQSLIRLLLYANEIDLEGLVATTSVWKRHSPMPESIRALIGHYDEVVTNLRLHDPRYPDASALEALVAEGQPGYGMESVGEGQDTPGSLALIARLEQDDPRPLWVNAWGGANTLAQALFTLRQTRSPEELARLVAKLRVYAISDQDDAGPWLRANFPELFYIVSPGGDYGSATWTGINAVIQKVDNTKISNPWLAANIQQGHGPLGVAYPDVAWGLEGDTPAFLALIPNGLSVPDRPEWGGWGGRYELYKPAPASDDAKNAVAGVTLPPETRPIWTNAEDAYTPPQKSEFGRPVGKGEVTHKSARATLWRWRDAFQNDFAARMDWTVMPYARANHPPVVRLQQPTRQFAKPGQGVWLSARGSTDPDGDSLSYYWFHYPEAGSYRGPVELGAENTDGIWLIAPHVSKTETVHVVLAVTDKGEPPLTRYERIILTVSP